MFSSALKSFTSNISANYSIATTQTAVSGPWKIYDGKKRSTGKAVSIFVFDRKSLDPQGGGLGGRGNTASLKRAHDEIVDRLKKEASSLARLRHPSILELAEPVEETRNGGLMFATEPVTASLAGVLDEKTDQEKAGGVGGRSSRYVVEDSEGGRRRRELEIDELEIQKGLLQVGKGLEFLHESAGLVHANLTPEAIFVNAKSDWKISGLGFSSPAEGANAASSVPAISLSEVLTYDARLPRSVQLHLDYASPDFVLDTNVTTSADMFSLGLVIIAIYNSPHRSPLDTNLSVTSYKRLFSSSSTVPQQSNNFLCSQNLPKEVTAGVLPRLITRRPAQRFTAREFQQAGYFDNILVSTIRFLDSLPAKTPNEKSQFLRGLPRILPQFPKSVLEKKILPVLVEETNDLELLSLVLQNIFKTVSMVPNGKRAFSERVIPCLRQVFASTPARKGAAQERETLKEGGLKVLLENMSVITENCSGKEFKDDIMPIVYRALESPTHAIVDLALQGLPTILPILDFSTVKNDLFPVVAQDFSKTSSMAIKIRGLEALGLLCGGTMSGNDTFDDDLNGVQSKAKPATTNAILDKYTVQEKVVPLLKGIKTKEPAVMMAALDVFIQVGRVADSIFLATDVLPSLWQFSLGPLLDLNQFQAFMTLIKSLSSRIEQEQTRKLQELTSNGTDNSRVARHGGQSHGVDQAVSTSNDQGDFENLVSGRKTSSEPSTEWRTQATASPSTYQQPSQRQNSVGPTFSWSSAPTNLPPSTQPIAQRLRPTTSRAVTPDVQLGSFSSLVPNNPTASFSQPMQPQRPSTNSMPPLQPQPSIMHSMGVLQPQPPSTGSVGRAHTVTPSRPIGTTVDWTAATAPKDNWGSMSSNLGFAKNLGAPPASSSLSSFKLEPPSSQLRMPSTAFGQSGGNAYSVSNQGSKQGLDKYESLL